MKYCYYAPYELKHCDISVIRSAPTSPSHMSGGYTPDSLSREGSPTPDDDGMQSMTPPTVNTVHRTQAMLPPSAADLRISQSAPGSPATQVLAG